MERGGKQAAHYTRIVRNRKKKSRKEFKKKHTHTHTHVDDDVSVKFSNNDFAQFDFNWRCMAFNFLQGWRYGKAHMLVARHPIEFFMDFFFFLFLLIPFHFCRCESPCELCGYVFHRLTTVKRIVSLSRSLIEILCVLRILARNRHIFAAIFREISRAQGKRNTNIGSFFFLLAVGIGSVYPGVMV